MITATQNPVSAGIEADARRVVAQLARLDARDLANRARAHALDLSDKVGGPDAHLAAEVFDRKADELRDLERTYAAAAEASEL